ncbi:uncharacterized protein BDW70DRAFT_145010 [Aspergillus foveolatus]|uniref:uncharacterized protein n=1 Tax=Aspergillus foveolatus TaxID=210207 RepID=UPI003CCD2A4D
MFMSMCQFMQKTDHSLLGLFSMISLLSSLINYIIIQVPAFPSSELLWRSSQVIR